MTPAGGPHARVGVFALTAIVCLRGWPIADMAVVATNLCFRRKSGGDVRYWHKADIGLCAAHVCF